MQATYQPAWNLMVHHTMFQVNVCSSNVSYILHMMIMDPGISRMLSEQLCLIQSAATQRVIIPPNGRGEVEGCMDKKLPYDGALAMFQASRRSTIPPQATRRSTIPPQATRRSTIPPQATRRSTIHVDVDINPSLHLCNFESDRWSTYHQEGSRVKDTSVDKNKQPEPVGVTAENPAPQLQEGGGNELEGSESDVEKVERRSARVRRPPKKLADYLCQIDNRKSGN